VCVVSPFALQMRAASLPPSSDNGVAVMMNILPFNRAPSKQTTLNLADENTYFHIILNGTTLTTCSTTTTTNASSSSSSSSSQDYHGMYALTLIKDKDEVHKVIIDRLSHSESQLWRISDANKLIPYVEPEVSSFSLLILQ
jgi:hypothetical protein